METDDGRLVLWSGFDRVDEFLVSVLQLDFHVVDFGVNSRVHSFDEQEMRWGARE